MGPGSHSAAGRVTPRVSRRRDRPAAVSFRGLPIYQKALVGAIIFSPLQSGFTLNLGFPLKISEVLIMFAVLSYFFGRRTRPTPSLERKLFVALGFLVGVSTAYHLLTPVTNVELHGFTRSPEVDLALYFFYSMLVLVMWLLMTTLPSGVMQKAMIWSIWVCAAATFLQWVLSQAGMLEVLETLNYQTKAKGLNLDGSDDDVMRTGSFVEGQQLGFFAGMMMLIALKNRAYIAVGLAVYCLIYSQSTTGFLGVAVAVATILFLRPRLNSILRFLLSGAIVAGILASVPALRTLLSFQLAKLGLFGLDEQFSGSDDSLDLRSIKTEIGARMTFDHPLIGVGPGRYGINFFDYATNPPVPIYYWNPDHRASAENVYIHISSELGIPALLCFVVALLALVLKQYRGLPVDFAVGLYLVIGIITQGSWTFIPIWIGLAYLAVNAHDLREKRLIRSRSAPSSPSLSATAPPGPTVDEPVKGLS
ncbi:hypothetical protein GCM10022198_11050 [Klugiella xanthotipulae]